MGSTFIGGALGTDIHSQLWLIFIYCSRSLDVGIGQYLQNSNMQCFSWSISNFVQMCTPFCVLLRKLSQLV